MTLTDIELRVLGVLMEKSLTQGGSYPMTMNAVVLAGNQKQNRDPVVEYAEGDVARALHMLQTKGLVKEAAPAPGARATRFAHNVLDKFKWDRRQQAVMAELMIRGRQTAGELRTHASRMMPFADLAAVSAVLAELKSAVPPFIEELPREPGRSANRYRHLLGEDAARPATTTRPSPAAEPPAGPPPSTNAAMNPVESAALANAAALMERLARLEQRVEELERRTVPRAELDDDAAAPAFADSP